jgi:hypothetical protein
MRLSLLAILFLQACAIDLPLIEDAGTDAGMIIEDAGTPMLTSPVLTDGGIFPTRYTCADTTTTGRVSPPFTWSPIPNAQSYAMVMTDTSINLVHWIIWDIAPTTLSLPEGVQNVALPSVPPGAKQTTSYDSTTYGYRGPCPPSPHVYRFDLLALDVTSLSGVTTSSSRAQVQAALTPHVLETLSLSSSWGP